MSTLKRLLPAALLLAAVLAGLAWRAQPDGLLHVYFPALTGDAAIIQLPDGGWLLVDGGADPSALTAALGRRLPFWQRVLQLVVLTVPDGRRLPGQVAALTRYRAARALAPQALRRSAEVTEWRRLLAEQGTPLSPMQPGAALVLGGGLRLTVLAAGDGAERGAILRLSYGRTAAVLDHSGDPADEELLAASARPADLLTFGWQREPQTALNAALHPRFVVFTDGHRENKPAEMTLPERAIGGAAVYHERLNGDLEWVSDGTRSWVVAEH